MRGRKAVINSLFSLLEEIVTIICGFILPRMILSAFGSTYNGLITSISQFLACAVLLRAGIGGATRAALYKPLAENNIPKTNSIVKATDAFMKRVGLILACIIVALAIVYPIFVHNEFGWLFTFSLFLIIGVSTFAESFFGITYLIVLQADQRLWVSSFIHIICAIANTTLCVVLILNGASIHIVKLGSAIVFVISPIVQRFYVRRHYKLDFHCEPDNEAIEQRWDAFWQQVSVFVMNNTDVMVLTVFSNLLEISVYSIYNMIANGLRNLVVSFFTSLEASFGNMIAKKEENALRENISVVEIFMFSISTIMYTCAAIQILSFVRIYTKNINDVNYNRPLFAYLIMLAGFFNGIRMPYQMVVQAAGHYKQTKMGAIIEPMLNIILSIIFVFKFGLIGVAIGTLAATIFRTIQYSFYMCKVLVKRSWGITFVRILVSCVESAIAIIIMNIINFPYPQGYIDWFIQTIITLMICSIVIVFLNLIVFRRDTYLTVEKLRSVFLKR